MCRKIGLAAVLVVAGLFLLNWVGLGSYTSTAWQKIKGNAKKQVPLEFEIERVRNQVSQLIPDMKKNLTVVAEEIVAVENLKEEIADIRTRLMGEQKKMQAMAKDLESGNKFVVYDGKQYSADRVREKLSRDFNSFKRCKAELESKEKLLEAKERALDAARQQLATIRIQKGELEVLIAQLEAELKTVRLAQSQSKYTFDDSKLAQAKATLADIKNRLNAEKNLVELEGQFANDNIPVEKRERSAKDLAKEVNTYFDNNGEEANAAEKK